jgi:predicted Holliday junction resolvase-like endonuclease
MDTLIKVLSWLKLNIKWLLFILVFILFTIFILWLASKNKKIKSLENQLAVMQAKLKIERLSLQYDTTMVELSKLKEKDEKVKLELEEIAKSLKETIGDSMTVEEIQAKFKELGL